MAFVSPERSMVRMPAVNASVLSLISIDAVLTVPCRRTSTSLARAKLTDLGMFIAVETFRRNTSARPLPPWMLSTSASEDTKSPKLVKAKVSLPAPPISVSAAPEPVILSSPAPPTIESIPAEPKRLSGWATVAVDASTLLTPAVSESALRSMILIPVVEKALLSSAMLTFDDVAEPWERISTELTRDEKLSLLRL